MDAVGFGAGAAGPLLVLVDSCVVAFNILPSTTLEDAVVRQSLRAPLTSFFVTAGLSSRGCDVVPDSFFPTFISVQHDIRRCGDL